MSSVVLRNGQEIGPVASVDGGRPGLLPCCLDLSRETLATLNDLLRLPDGNLYSGFPCYFLLQCDRIQSQKWTLLQPRKTVSCEDCL